MFIRKNDRITYLLTVYIVKGNTYKDYIKIFLFYFLFFSSENNFSRKIIWNISSQDCAEYYSFVQMKPHNLRLI